MSMKKYISPCGVFTYILAFACLVFQACHVMAIEKQDLFRTVRSFDDVYMKGVYTSGSRFSSLPPWGWQTKNQIANYEWAYTRSEPLRAVFEVSKLVSQLSGDEEIVPSRRLLLFDQKRSGQKLITLLSEVPHKDYATSRDIRDAVLNLSAPDSMAWRFQTDLFFFAMGRGVAIKIDFLNEVNESIERNGEKCVLITGQCGEYLSEKGIWKAYVIPDAAYMVRQAQYLCNDNMILEIETFGLNRQNDCFYPEKTEIKYHSGGKSDVHKFVFSDARLEFDSDLFDRVVREFDEELPDRSLKIDSSSGKDIVQIIGGEEPYEPYILDPRPFFSGLKIFAIVLNLIGIPILIYLYYRSRHKRIKPS